ncbi:SDR family oxidoreductase [Nocardia arthritidis]|uniref:NAD(P)H-binding protein n=1 Tax=Nocardia arthritidis TaxID=228602 RepID=A0A6G9YAT3_9NOCA|nr:NAD(P)H-binding protein [Nocardia arthritidis]QIS10153.1 NAD(P)H-binding protein [Nocardia arthritidis]
MFLVTGATGSVGRHVVAGLVAEGHPVRALTRNPNIADIPGAAEVLRGDLAEPDGLTAALRGVRTVYLMAMGDAPERFVDLAERAGVQRIVLLSTGDVRDDVKCRRDAVAEHHARFENAIRSSRLEWTFLRPNEFAGNSLHWAPQVRTGDVVRAPYGQARTSPIHERDIAAVAVRALVDDGHDRAAHYLSGPHTLTHVDQLDLIGAALGRTLHFEEIPAAQAREDMTRYAPPMIVDAVLGQLAAAVAHPVGITHTVEEITGRPPRTFAEWATEHAAEFR